MAKVETKGKVGRPKKSPLIPPTSFRGIGTKENPVLPEKNGFIEWTYTEVSHFKETIKTYKSSDVEVIYFYFLSHKIVIKGITNQYQKVGVSRYLREIIKASDTYSYYTRQNYYFKINLTEWSEVLDDMDESCNKFSIVYYGGDKLEVTITNASIGCDITNTINAVITDGDEHSSYDKLIAQSVNTYVAKFNNVKTGDMKGLLGKSSRKNSQNAIFLLKGNVCELIFEVSPDRHQKIEFNITRDGKTKPNKEQFQIISQAEGLHRIQFPCADLHKFLIHMKNQVMELYLTKLSMIAVVSKPRIIPSDKPGNHSILTYYVPINELDRFTQPN